MDSSAFATRVEQDATHVGTGGSVVDWINESGAIVAGPGFYPARKVPAAYIETWRPVAETHLMQAGLRLAATLNRLLG